MGASASEGALSAVSLFAGIGGLDLGFRAAGIEPVVLVEQDACCCLVLRRGFPESVVLDEDIAGVSGRRILRAGKLRKGDVNVLTAGPPCQRFSKSGYGCVPILSHFA